MEREEYNQERQSSEYCCWYWRWLSRFDNRNEDTSNS